MINRVSQALLMAEVPMTHTVRPFSLLLFVPKHSRDSRPSMNLLPKVFSNGHQLEVHYLGSHHGTIFCAYL
jgi:hypothetical protein